MLEFNDHMHGLTVKAWKSPELEGFLIHLNQNWDKFTVVEAHVVEVSGDQFNEQTRLDTERRVITELEKRLSTLQRTVLIIGSPVWYHAPVSGLNITEDVPMGYPTESEVGLCFVQVITIPVYRK